MDVFSTERGALFLGGKWYSAFKYLKKNWMIKLLINRKVENCQQGQKFELQLVSI